MKAIKYMLFAAMAAIIMSSCEKVSPIGVLVAGTAVEDRVKMSHSYFNQYKNEFDFKVVENEYTFLVGADSHLTTDPGRMDEMLKIGLDDDDLFYCHLGDIADTKPEYYITLDSLLEKAKERYIAKYYGTNSNGYYYPLYDQEDAEIYSYTEDLISYPFFPVVGNHDITHNGWALWSNIFHSSFYEFPIFVDDDNGNEYIDRFIFLDSASGTLGRTQIDLIEAGVLDGDNGINYRHTFVFGHTNIFRPSSMEFASTFSREETFFLLNQFEKWNASGVFCGHVHKYDERLFNNVAYITLDSMSERNSPEPGDYLVRVTVKSDGSWYWEPVHMSYVAPKK